MKINDASKIEKFQFRDLHPNVFVGTASDRYAGWLGQIYSEDRYSAKITKRKKRVGKKDFEEEVLPVQSVQEYFEHFGILELDFTFYSPLINKNGEPTKSLHVLRSYRSHLKENDRLILKVPQIVFARKIWGKTGYDLNPEYLSPDLFIDKFYQPAVDLLDPWLAGFIFEQEYQRKQDRITPEVLADGLAAFFEAIPKDKRYHVELRTEPFLSPPLFKVFENFGIGQVLSHWTWLPSLSKQFLKGGGKTTNSLKHLIVRLMTPKGMRYEEAYAKAFPFNSIVDGMISPSMIEETVDVMETAIREDSKISVIVNNRAGGNAPIIAQRIMQQFLQSRKKEN
ncbi:DUF72 domain-containing protein [Thermodesulfobacteriota bacterium]